MSILDKLDNLNYEFSEVQKRESLLESYIENRKDSIIESDDIGNLSRSNSSIISQNVTNNEDKVPKLHQKNSIRKSILNNDPSKRNSLIKNTTEDKEMNKDNIEIIDKSK
jgi:hypothetical protein